MPEGSNGIQVRLTRLEKDMEEVRKDLRDADYSGMRVRVEHLVREVGELSTEVHGLRRVLIQTAVSFAASALVFALSILAATGKIG